MTSGGGKGTVGVAAGASLAYDALRVNVMRTNQCAVYILTNRHRTVLYTGVTSDLRRRLAEHRAGTYASSFAARYSARVLVYLETTPNVAAAIRREKQIKGWTRRKKIELIEGVNPGWKDLSAEWEG